MALTTKHSYQVGGLMEQWAHRLKGGTTVKRSTLLVASLVALMSGVVSATPERTIQLQPLDTPPDVLGVRYSPSVTAVARVADTYKRMYLKIKGVEKYEFASWINITQQDVIEINELAATAQEVYEEWSTAPDWDTRPVGDIRVGTITKRTPNDPHVWVISLSVRRIDDISLRHTNDITPSNGLHITLYLSGARNGTSAFVKFSGQELSNFMYTFNAAVNQYDEIAALENASQYNHDCDAKFWYDRVVKRVQQGRLRNNADIMEDALYLHCVQ